MMHFNVNLLTKLICLSLAISLLQCSDTNEETSTVTLPYTVVTGSNNTQAPNESTPVQTFSEEAARALLDATNVFIEQSRKLGLQKAQTIYQSVTQQLGKNASVLADVTDASIRAKWSAAYKSYIPNKGTGQATYFLTDGENQYIECALTAPEKDVTLTGECAEIIALADAEYEKNLQSFIEIEKANIEEAFKDTESQYVQGILKQLNETDLAKAKQFIIDWSVQAITFAQEAARIEMIAKLREERQCDVDMDRKLACYRTGVEHAKIMTTKMKYFTGNRTAWEVLWSLNDTCSLNWMTVINMIRNVLMEKRSTFIHEEHFCLGYDYNRDNPAYINCNEKDTSTKSTRIEGLVEGINNEIAKMTQALRDLRSANCPPPPSEPLVLDLDGNGISLSTNKVPFDMFANGKRSRSEWISPREGFLAMDLNHNGRIDSIAELFGDRSQCLTGLCNDGISALRMLDINRDGIIDEKDPAFGELLVWVDRNQDGESQRNELSQLRAYSIRSLSLNEVAMSDSEFGQPGIAKIQVSTDASSFFAYDVMLHVVPSMENLFDGFGPAKVK